MLTTTFIYCPKSGTQVFSQKDSREIVQVAWENGSLHVIGGTRFSFGSAHQGAHCRADAQRLVEEVIEVTGGVAWDDRGEINVIVPNKAAPDAVRILQEALPEAAWNNAALWRAGVLTLVEVGRYEFRDPAMISRGDTLLIIEEPEDGVQPVAGGAPEERVIVGLNSQGVEVYIDRLVKPEKGWGRPAVSGGLAGVKGEHALTSDTFLPQCCWGGEGDPVCGACAHPGGPIPGKCFIGDDSPNERPCHDWEEAAWERLRTNNIVAHRR